MAETIKRVESPSLKKNESTVGKAETKATNSSDARPVKVVPKNKYPTSSQK